MTYSCHVLRGIMGIVKGVIMKSPIYEYSVNQKKLKGCGTCSSVPCDIWKNTKDPSLSDEEFEHNIQERVGRLRK